MIGKIEKLSRYIVCSRVTKRPIFEFINSAIRPNDALQVFPLSDDYSFGILQSSIHWLWFTERCSTLKGDFRYTSNSVFDTFPWPQNPTSQQVINVASAAVDLIKVRCQFMDKNQSSLREIYQNLEQTKNTKLHQAQENLDRKVRSAYGIKNNEEPLKFLFELNLEVANQEANNQSVISPGMPPFITN